jgi:hypothetical protein
MKGGNVTGATVLQESIASYGSVSVWKSASKVTQSFN